MMVAKPEQWVDDIAKAGGEMYTFHIEATNEPVALIKQIHAAGMKAGVAIKPKTPADVVIGEVGELADMVLVMTVEPGFGGQRFMAECMPKVKRRCLIRRTGGVIGYNLTLDAKWRVLSFGHHLEEACLCYPINPGTNINSYVNL